MEEIVCPNCLTVLDRGVGMIVTIDLDSYKGTCPCGSNETPLHYHNGTEVK